MTRQANKQRRHTAGTQGSSRKGRGSHAGESACVSLGACLFGGQVAPGYALPQEDVPGPWLTALAYHADSAVFGGVFSMCRAGRLWVLTTAPHATLRLDATVQQSITKWLQQLSAAAESLTIRGGLPTALHLVCDGSPCCFAMMGLALSRVQQASTGISALTVLGSEAVDSAALTALLTHAATALPGLSTLTCDSCACALPPLPTLPHLHTLSMALTTEPDADSDSEVDQITVWDLFRSLSPYVTQLRSIELVQDVPPGPVEGESDSEALEAYGPGVDEATLFHPWQMLLTAPSHTLTSFSATTFLDQELAGESVFLMNWCSLHLWRGICIFADVHTVRVDYCVSCHAHHQLCAGLCAHMCVCVCVSVTCRAPRTQHTSTHTPTRLQHRPVPTEPRTPDLVRTRAANHQDRVRVVRAGRPAQSTAKVNGRQGGCNAPLSTT